MSGNNNRSSFVTGKVLDENYNKAEQHKWHKMHHFFKLIYILLYIQIVIYVIHDKVLDSNDDHCYMPVRELRSTSFSVIPVTSSSFPSCLCHSCHLFVVPVMSPSFPSLLRHRHLFVLLTVHYRLSSSPRLSSFVYSFVTDLFRPFYVPSIISRICGYAIIL